MKEDTILSRDRVTTDGVWIGNQSELLDSYRSVTTSKNYTPTDLQTSQITIGHTRSSQCVTVFTSHCLATASKGGRSSS
jgi:hypothetical protein